MAKYKRGDIVLVDFPFIKMGQEKKKLRPALVISDFNISKRYEDVNIIPISSKIPNDLIETEILINQDSGDFPNTGLVKSSIVKCETVITLPEDLIIRKIGQLSDNLLRRVDVGIKLVLGIK